VIRLVDHPLFCLDLIFDVQHLRDECWNAGVACGEGDLGELGLKVIGADLGLRPNLLMHHGPEVEAAEMLDGKVTLLDISILFLVHAVAGHCVGF
jgi:hypothetical protein